MISKRYNKLFNNFEVLKQTDAKHRVSLDNIAQVKKELKDIKNIGKFTSKKSNVFFDDIKLNYKQIDTELNHLRDAILTDQIFDNSEVQILSNKFNDIFDISHSLNLIKNVLDKKNIITDILYLELHQSQTSFSKLFKTELNNLLNEKKTTKGVNSDLINFKNILDKYTEFNQKKIDETKNKNGVDISVLFLNKKYIANILSTKQIDNVESYTERLFGEINNFNEAFNDLLTQYEKHINSSAGQINKKIKEHLENKNLKNKNILKDIEFILNANKTAFEQTQDKKEAEKERLRLEKEAEEERLRQEEQKRLIAQKNAERVEEQANLEAKKRKESSEKLGYFIGFIALIALAALCLWGLWELSIYIWLSYAGIVVNTIGAVLAIISAIVFFGASKLLGVIFFVITAFIYIFLDDLVPHTDIKSNNKTEIIKKLKVPSLIPNQIKKCPSSGYKDNCKGRMSYGSDTYIGFFKNNKRHGQGTYVYKNGTKLTGTFYKSLPSYGTETYAGKWKGDRYTGNFENWNRSGQGTYYFQNGDKYSGNWKNNKKHGRGNYTWKSGIKYVGQWQKNEMHGQGVKTFKNGKIQKGIWKNDKFIGSKSEKSLSKYQTKAKETIKSYQNKKCPSSGYKDNCIGRIIYTSDNVYEGFFKKNKRHGQGTYYFNKGKWKGDKYIGQWKDNKYYGEGTYYWNNGRKYVGQWKNDKKHGQGTLSWPNGNKYVGQWQKGKQHGQGIKTYKNGKIEKGIWKNGNFLYVQESQNP